MTQWEQQRLYVLSSVHDGRLRAREAARRPEAALRRRCITQACPAGITNISAMVDISVRDGVVRFGVLGLHKLWALKGCLDVPLEHIKAVRADPSVSLGWGGGIRLPGTHIPGRLKAGTYYQRGRRIFWDVARTAGAIVVELSGDRYDELVVEVRDPAAAVAQLQDAGRRRGS